MPSMFHEAVLHLFHNRPGLLPELLREKLRVPVPSYSEVRIEESDFTQLTPTEYRADLVLALRHSATGPPVLAIVVEVQLSCDPRKRYVWPEYVTNVHRHLECPVCLLVFTRSSEVARWCAVPLVIGPMGSVINPIVLSSESIPSITDADQAHKDPELATLSAMVHGTWETARVAIDAVRHLDEERSRLYIDLIDAHLEEGARSKFEELMTLPHYEYQGDFARRYFNQGKSEGEARGEAKGEAKAILTVLETRGISLSDEGRSRVHSCKDLSQLDQWLRRVALVASEDELFH